MEHHTVGVWQAAGGGTSRDDSARFLRELRQLRDYAGLGQIELAARAHYPHDYIRAAETGPALPDLPLLSAYVRGCGGTLEDWEERWRRLTNTPALTLLPTRSAGASTAASAGSRIGLAFQDASAPDPAAIMAALNRVAEKIAADTSSPARSSRPAQSPAAQSPAAQSPVGKSPATTLSAKPDRAAAPRAATSVASSATTAPAAAPSAPAASAPAESKPTAAATSGTGAATGGGTSRGVTARAGRSFSMTSRTTIAALIALAICVIVAVLAVFA